MKILVIDDASWNQESARQTLADHELTVLGTVEEAFEMLRWGRATQFQAVLTDLWMPAPKPVYNSGCDRLFETIAYHPENDTHLAGDSIPAGMVFAIAARNCNVPYVAICTDGNHHNDRMVTLMDLIDIDGGDQVGLYKIEARSFCLKGQVGTGGALVKDWGKILEHLIALTNEDRK